MAEEHSSNFPKEIRLKGAPLSDGIAIGTLFYFSKPQEELLPEFSITDAEVDREITRYRSAVSSSKEDLESLQQYLVHEGSLEAVSIIDTHIQMLEDPLMTTVMEDKIRVMLRNTETVFRSVMSEYEKQFSKKSDAFFKQRLLDVKDLSSRILYHLYPRKKNSLHDLPENTIVFGYEFIPSDIAVASSNRICAFIAEIGGGTSHTALIARSKGMPFIANISTEFLKNHNIAPVIVDGEKGELILYPEKKTLKMYQKKKELNQKIWDELIDEVNLPMQTLDSKEIEIYANIERLEDIDLMHEYGAKGIGLFRSEFLFFKKQFFESTEEEQITLYQKILSKAKGLPVIFRLFDLGGDKDFFPTETVEPNPALGCRAIRFLLRHRNIFRLQVRALLKAAAPGEIRLLIPLISDLSELREAKRFIFDIQKDLIREGSPIPSRIEIGSMIEVPSAVMICDALAKESDFLSIGTNDLAQYTLVADRSNPIISDTYHSLHPSIVRFIEMIIKSGKKIEKPVSLCGEIASNPLLILPLIGLGVEKLSCSPRFIPLIKRTIRKISFKEAEKLAKQILTIDDSEKLYEVVRKAYDSIIS